MARLNQTPPSWVGRYFQEHALFVSPEFLVEEFNLYSSVLGRKGVSHAVERVYALAAHEQGTQ